MAVVPELDLSSEVVERVRRATLEVLHFYRLVAHVPKALDGFLSLTEALAGMGLPRPLRELAYLRVASLLGGIY